MDTSLNNQQAEIFGDKWNKLLSLDLLMEFLVLVILLVVIFMDLHMIGIFLKYSTWIIKVIYENLRNNLCVGYERFLRRHDMMSGIKSLHRT